MAVWCEQRPAGSSRPLASSSAVAVSLRSTLSPLLHSCLPTVSIWETAVPYPVVHPALFNWRSLSQRSDHLRFPRVCLRLRISTVITGWMLAPTSDPPFTGIYSFGTRTNGIEVRGVWKSCHLPQARPDAALWRAAEEKPVPVSGVPHGTAGFQMIQRLTAAYQTLKARQCWQTEHIGDIMNCRKV